MNVFMSYKKLSRLKEASHISCIQNLENIQINKKKMLEGGGNLN